jgi:hypothetical protein
MQNGYIENSNDKFRDECHNEKWFETLHQARLAIGTWRKDYNEVRPHGSIGRMPPARWRCNSALINHHGNRLTLQPGLPIQAWYDSSGKIKGGQIAYGIYEFNRSDFHQLDSLRISKISVDREQICGQTMRPQRIF